MYRSITLTLMLSVNVLSTGAYASDIGKDAINHTHKDVRPSHSIAYVQGSTLSSTGVNVLNFPANINQIDEPPNQSLRDDHYLQEIDSHSVMLSTGDYHKITLIVKLNNGHYPFILHFNVGNIPSQNINIGTDIAGANATVGSLKRGKDASSYQAAIIATTKAVLVNDQSDSFATQLGGDCQSLHEHDMGSFSNIYHKLCGINQSALKPLYIKKLTSDHFNILHAKVCSQVFHIHIKAEDYAKASQILAITITNKAPAIGQCFDVVALSAKDAP